MPGKNYSSKVKKIRELLTSISQKAAEVSQFVQRRSKMGGMVFVQMWVLGCLQKAGISLAELSKVSSKLGVTISGPGLDQRIDGEAVKMMQQVFQACIEQLSGGSGLAIELLKHFSAVFITDSTQIELPAGLQAHFPGSGGKASPAGMKIQVLFEFLSSTFRAMEIGASNQPDQKSDLHLRYSQAGALHLFDLGYFNQCVLAALANAKAYFITRLDHQTALFEAQGEETRINLLDMLRKSTLNQIELHLKIGRLVHLPVRALFQRLPPDVAAKRRHKAIANMKDKGRTPSQTYLALCEWNMFITNIPDDWLSFDNILLLYRLRWQIELVFKLWKSQGQLDQIGPWREERVLVQLYARLIGLTIFFSLSAPFRWLSDRELSLPKAFASFQAKIPAILRAIHNGWHAFHAVLMRLFAHWRRFDLKTTRHKHPSTLNLLLGAAPP